MRKFPFISAQYHVASGRLFNELSNVLSFLETITADTVSDGIRDDRVRLLKQHIGEFDYTQSVTHQCRQLVRIHWYAQSISYNPLIKLINQHAVPLLQTSLDPNDPYAMLMLANAPSGDANKVVDVTRFAHYDHQFRSIVSGLKCCRFGRKSAERVLVETMRSSLVSLRKRYEKDSVNFNTLAAIEISVTASTLLDKIMGHFRGVSISKHHAWWKLIDAISTLMAKAQCYYKLPQRKDSMHRQQLLMKKDSLNAIKDSATLVEELKSSSMLQQFFLLLDRLYKVERLLDWSDAVDDIAWFGTLIYRIESAYHHVCDMLTSILKNNPSPTGQTLGLIMALFSVRQSLSSEPFNYLNFKRQKGPKLTDKYAKKMREDKVWQHQYKQSLIDVMHHVTEAYAGLRIRILGGTEPLVFQVQCRGKSNKGMVLRLSMLGMDPANQAAIDYLQINNPSILGELYQSFDDVGDMIQGGSCAEFFPNGTLEDFIVSLHREKGSQRFTSRQQHQLFSHLSQMLEILMSCHQGHIIFPDIKPSNFLFASDPAHDVDTRLVISDLKSLKQVSSDQWLTTDVAYTAAYKAPEVAVCDNGMLVAAIDARPHDVYALGVTLWMYLTGTHDMTIKFEPRDQFERVMLKMVKGLTQINPSERLSFAEQVHDDIGKWRHEALPGRLGAVAGRAASLFSRSFKGMLRGHEAPKEGMVNEL